MDTSVDADGEIDIVDDVDNTFSYRFEIFTCLIKVQFTDSDPTCPLPGYHIISMHKKH